MPPARYPQFSFATLLVLTAVMCATAAGLFYASGVRVIREELKVYFDVPFDNRTGSGNGPWLVFLLFTYTAPLLMAGFLSTFTALWRLLDNRRIAREDREADSATDDNAHPLD
jgi:hypothetical protein